MYRIESTTILTPQNGLNIYRGRTEDSIMLTEIRGQDPMDVGIKYDADDLLATTLRARRGKGMIVMGNLGDPYNKWEEELCLTRKCLMVIENSDYGVCINTHQQFILRDLDVLEGISSKTKCIVDINIPTFDEKKLERLDGSDTMSVQERLNLISTLKMHGISVVVSVSPIVPYVTDNKEELLYMIKELSGLGVRHIDFLDFRTGIQKAVRDFFYTEYHKRFPEEYEMYMKERKNDGEIVANNSKALLKELGDVCRSKKIMYDTRQIRLWRRQYENKTVGTQLSLF